MRLSQLNPWRDLSGLPRDSWILALVTLINRAGAMVLPFMMLHLTRNLHFTAARAGLALSIYGVAALLCAPLTGRLSDQLGPLRILKFSFFAGAIAMWLLPLARTWEQVVVGLIALALTSEAFRPASLALVGELAGSSLRKQGFALNRLAVNLGMSVGPAVGGVLAALSFRSLFWVNGVTSFLAGAVLIARPIRTSARPEVNRAAQIQQRGRLGPPRPLLYFLLALLPTVMVFFQHQGTMPLYMVSELGLSEAAYGFMFTINTLIIVLFEVRLNGAMAHWPHQRALALGALLCGAGFGALALARDLWTVAATVLIWTIGEMILFPVSAAYVTEIAPPERRGLYLGYYTMSFGLAFAIGPGAGAAIMQRYGSATLWAGTLMFGALSAALLARVHSIAPASTLQPDTSLDPAP
jgi:MFS family permease